MKSFAPKPWVVPQPVLIIGTYNKEGVANAMNAAWAGQWDMKEIMISMGNHVTTDNLKLGGEFTVAFATKKTMVASDFVGIVSAKNAPKKMEKTGWNIEKATMVNAPVFTDFPMTLECRIKEKYDESETGYYLVGNQKCSVLTTRHNLRMWLANGSENIFLPEASAFHHVPAWLFLEPSFL